MGAPLPDLLPLYAPGPERQVRGGMVLSADGGAGVDGRSGGLHTPADQAAFMVLRAHADVVLVGAGTARTEGYGPVALSAEHQAWRVAQGRPANPPLALVSRSMELPAKALPGALVITCGAPRGSDPAHLVRAGDDSVDLAGALDQLAGRGLTRVLCEGGPRLLGDLLLAGLLDEVCVTISPRFVGRGAGSIGAIIGVELPEPVELALEHVVEHDGTLLLRWRIARERGSAH
jgi:riboflavin biosynthesis pyrimidine reductase